MCQLAARAGQRARLPLLVGEGHRVDGGLVQTGQREGLRIRFAFAAAVVSYYLMLVIMGLSIAYFVYKSNHVKVEDINQKSNDIVGYRTLIPLAFIGLSAFINVGVTNFYYIFGPLAIILTYLSFALYQRSFKLKFRYWIEVSIYVLIEIALFVTLLVIGI